MSTANRHDAWKAGDSYDFYMGRWSRKVAPLFLAWLEPKSGLDWLEVGCGTGALTAAILALAEPKTVIAVDPSEGFLARARQTIEDPRATFATGDAQELKFENQSRDMVVSALALNFVPDRAKALGEMARVVRPAGTVAFYVWDYPGRGVEFMRSFWTAATAIDSTAAGLTEDTRFPFCTPPVLVGLSEQAGLRDVKSTAFTIDTVFKDFEDFWQPFTLGAGPAPGFCMSLDPQARQRLKDELQSTLPRDRDGSIALTARAWGIKAEALR